MKILISLSFLLVPLVVAAVACCRAAWRQNTKSRLFENAAFRKLYCHLLLLVLLAFHLSYNLAFPHSGGLMVSTCVLIYIVSARRTERLMARVSASRSLLVFLMTLVLGLAMSAWITTFCVPLAVTLAYVLVAACLFPSSFMPDDEKES